MPSDQPALARLRAADVRLRDEMGDLGTLAPDRTTATPLLSLGHWCLSVSTAGFEAFADGLSALVQVQVTSFPENIFWDQDYLVASVVRSMPPSGGDAAHHFKTVFDQLIRIHQLFGRETAIRFRYLHDFSYGFDWAKWVGRRPAERCHHGPFSQVFLTAIERRGHALLDAIDTGDTEYPPLPTGESRNPFGFHRDPVSEARLFRTLAEERWLPVEAWSVDGLCDWQRPYQQHRSQRAATLGLSLGEPAA